MSEVKEFKTTQSLELSSPGKDWSTYCYIWPLRVYIITKSDIFSCLIWYLLGLHEIKC